MLPRVHETFLYQMLLNFRTEDLYLKNLSILTPIEEKKGDF
jgi:hypothetical protein